MLDEWKDWILEKNKASSLVYKGTSASGVSAMPV